MNLQKRAAFIVFSIIFLVVLIMNIYLFIPLLHSILFAAILAGTFYPFHQKVLDRCEGRKELASLITTCLITLLILLPMVYTILQVSKEGMNLYQMINSSLSQTEVRNFFFGSGPFARLLQGTLDLFQISISKQEIYQELLSKTQGATSLIVDTFNGLISNTFNILFQFAMMILAMYGLFLEGPRLKRYVFTLSPLPDEDEERILRKFNQMNYVTLVGNGLGGIIQGVLAGLIFWICGIPSVFLWTTVMVILAFIPLLGISIITVPASIILFLQGFQAKGIILLITTGLIAFIVENWFKPRFIGAKVKVNSLVLLFYIIAGMTSFGMPGIFYGPIFCIIFITLGEILFEKYLPIAQKKENQDA